MKRLYTLSAFLFLTGLSFAQTVPDSTKKKQSATDHPAGERKDFDALEHPPEYPGGVPAFSSYISSTLKYPEVARLIGIDGRLVVTFIIERDGKVTNVTPVNCIGAGCEAEAVRVLQGSKPWTPGVQNGRPVRVQYSVPISFSVDKGKVSMKELRASKYGFVFNIKERLYTIDEAQEILGGSFQSGDVKIAEPFYNEGNNPRFLMPDKNEVYLVKMKD
ncbi:energy transducer TonB [Mucilaginibacter psychrotolerans]|uniref:Energy transducer TonB n=1 Tax=Mucilaginibacter psychrotolerans TaxID=1524096 RepID=A0A4Y8S5C5_9SPHI|nr:energy transducer TonB [Mucilaginibacter psychrotolerans]TFF33825.1 energy transducer TonB [Mucilaginibacter psychrotolerans]